jgi:predicted transcriptional regulator
LGDENRALPRSIRDAQPESLTSLAHLTGRKPGNLSRTLKGIMPSAELIEIDKRKSA